MFDNPSKAKMIFGAAGVLVTLGVGAAAWYTFPVLKRHDAMLAKNAGLKQSVETLGGRIDQQNSKLAEVTSDIDSIKEKVAGLETSRETDRAQVAALESELGQLRKEMAEQTQQLNDKIAASGAGTEKLVAGLEASQERDRKEVDGLNKKLATRRIDFEVNKGHSYELSPGISLEINGTDIAYRRVTGWMWVLPDRRTIWLREQGAQEPVVFYSNNDGKKRELVITAVTKHSAVGYLVVPDESKTESAAVVGAESNASE